ncbi:MAG: ThiF family adenylyltransferase [Deltaproteobacteria bacterium]|nr:ThiF family adenylyltransferase [Deltaproteobacteria bacterium]
MKIDSATFIIKPGQTKIVSLNFSSFIREQKIEQQPGIYVGKLKVFVAKDRLQKLNEFVEIETFSFKLDSNNAHTLMSTFDVIVDGTDDLVTKYLMNDVCVKLNKAFVYASVFQFQGYLSVFNYRNGPHLRHVYPQCPPSSLVQNCSAAGVLGVLPGILGVLQANEVIKILTGIGSVLSGKFLVFDSLRLKFDFFDIEYLNVIPAFSMKCMSVGPEEVEMALVAEISVQEFKKMIDKKEKFQLIDVREQFEYDIVNLGGKLLPLSEIEKDPQILKENISSNIPVIVHCRSGGRSGHVCQILQEKFQYNNVFNLAGGVLAYAEHIDPTLPRY